MITTLTEPNTKENLLNILHPLVKKWFLSKFKDFALPQKFGVMPIHSRENILISSPTGSGKTLTAFLAILNELVDSATKGILEDKTYCIYLSPLKALGYDIKVNLLEPLKEIEELAQKPLGIRVGVRTGDTTQSERQKMIKTPPHILITTPESIALMLISPRQKENLKSIDWVIVDEIHAMAENKRGVHLSLMLEHLQYQNEGMCRIGLSATVSPLEKVAQFLVGTKRDCKIVDISFLKEMNLEVISPVDDLINTDYNQIQDKLYQKVHDLIQEHKTTLIFTNTRAATERVVHTLKEKYPKSYYELQENPPYKYSSLIGAHHGSLSKEHRFDIEQKLREGKLRCGVCSTSLELGIDIGSIDLVIVMGSPKSVARFLQRAGRAGHKLQAITKAKMVVLDRDDLIECSVLLKHAIEHKIDRIHIPKNSYDILVQHILGFVLNQTIDYTELYELTKKSYCYENLDLKSFNEIVTYLAGEYDSLQNRNIFAKIWKNDDGTLSKRGKLTRMIYASNLGTIPSSSGVIVKIGNYPVGSIDEGFLERLKKGDRFVLGGDVYEFLYAKGMTAQVKSAQGKGPTIPSWFSESLPLNYDLAKGIQNFRSKIFDELQTYFQKKKTKKEVIEVIKNYLYVKETTGHAIFQYMKEEYLYTLPFSKQTKKQKKKENKEESFAFPKSDTLLIEKYLEESTENTFEGENKKHYYLFHSLHGRRANEALSRVFAYALGKFHHTDIEIGINDNGFYLATTKNIEPTKIIDLIETHEFIPLLHEAINATEILRRRFRQCAERALMILRNYKGNIKNTGRQQVSSMILMKAAQKVSADIGHDFIILKEAYREVMEEVMDIENALEVYQNIKTRKQKLKQIEVNLPSPFATNLYMQGYADVVSITDRHTFLQQMHKLVLAKIATQKDLDNDTLVEVSNNLRKLSSLETIEQTIRKEKQKRKENNKTKQNQTQAIPTYEELWEQEEQKEIDEEQKRRFILRKEAAIACKKRDVPYDICENLFAIIEFKDKRMKKKTKDYFKEEFKGTISKFWTDSLIKLIKEKIKED